MDNRPDRLRLAASRRLALTPDERAALELICAQLAAELLESFAAPPFPPARLRLSRENRDT